MLNQLLRVFKSIRDYRVIGRTKYPLVSILTITFTGILCGARGWAGIQEFAATKAYWFKRLLPKLTDIPSVDTLARTVSNLDPTAFRTAVTKLATYFIRRALHRKPGRRAKSELPDAIDLAGKTVRGATKPGNKKSCVHIVNAVIGFVTIAVEMVKEKSNEITAIPIVIDILHKFNLLKGKVLTSDAMGCQKKIAEHIIHHGADFLFGLKGNQTALLKQVVSVFSVGLLRHDKEFVSATYTTQPEKAGGIVGHRDITVVYLTTETIFEWLPAAKDWVGIGTIIMVENFNDTDGTSEIRYFISSLTLKARQLAEIQKLHWRVETMHKILDDRGSFDEDHCKVHRGSGAEILSIMRKLAINAIVPIWQFSHDNDSKKESFGSIARLLKDCPQYLEEVLTKPPEQISAPSVWRDRVGEGLYAK